MSDLTITCRRCKNQIAHVCSEDLRTAAIALFKWRPQSGFPDALKRRNPWVGKTKRGYDVDGPEIPFLSEVYQYALLGKEDGRTMLALVNNLLRAAGLEPIELEEAANSELETAQLAREDAERRTVAARKRKKLVPVVTVRLDINQMLRAGKTDKEIVAALPVTLRTMRAFRKLWTPAAAEVETLMSAMRP